MKKLNTLGITHLLIPLIVVVVGVAAVGTYMKVSSDAASVCARTTIGEGYAGKCYEPLAVMLRAHAAYPLKNDGVYGPKMKASVASYQSKTGLQSDGIAGKATWKTLCGTTYKKLKSSKGKIIGYEYRSKVQTAYKDAGCKVWGYGR